MDFFEGQEKTLEIWFAPLSPQHSGCRHPPFTSRERDSDSGTSTPAPFEHDPAVFSHSTLPSPTGSSRGCDQEANDEDLVGTAQRPQDLLSSVSNTRTGDLRLLSRAAINEILTTAKCAILEEHHNAHISSYVLSESSLFITAHRIILKTCGQTQLLAALPSIIDHARAVGLNHVEDVVFSHRQLLRPCEQVHPHTSFKDEVGLLRSHFKDSYASTFGKEDSTEAWHLFAFNRAKSREVKPLADTTIELLMQGLPAAISDLFTMKDDVQMTADGVTSESGIVHLFPSADIKAFLFEPCGYSCNGILGDGYFTIHVTPQSDFSFVSFETDIIMEDYTELMLQVLRIFQPSNFVVNTLANRHCSFPIAARAFSTEAVEKSGYDCVCKEQGELPALTIDYRHFQRRANSQ